MKKPAKRTDKKRLDFIRDTMARAYYDPSPQMPNNSMWGTISMVTKSRGHFRKFLDAADRLSIIEEGKGHWAECIQAIEQFGRQAHAQGRREAFEEVVKYAQRIYGSEWRDIADHFKAKASASEAGKEKSND